LIEEEDPMIRGLAAASLFRLGYDISDVSSILLESIEKLMHAGAADMYATAELDNVRRNITRALHEMAHKASEQQ
jgi:hypothetical protein